MDCCAYGSSLPDMHFIIVHRCRNSGYEVLADPVNGSRYCRAYQLDDVGNGLVVDRARSLGAPGSCSTCTGSGTLIRGFRVRAWRIGRR